MFRSQIFSSIKTNMHAHISLEHAGNVIVLDPEIVENEADEVPAPVIVVGGILVSLVAAELGTGCHSQTFDKKSALFVLCYE